MRCIVDKKHLIGIDRFDTVRVKVVGQTVKIYCYSNLGVQQEVVLKADNTEDGTVIFGAKELLSKIKTTKSECIQFKNNVVSNGKSVFHKMPILPDNDKPDLIDSKRKFDWTVTLSANDFCEALDSVVFCVLNRADRPMTNNVCLVLSEDTLTSYGFDGYRIACHKIGISIGRFIREEIFVHVSSIGNVKNWAKDKKDIKICKSGGWMYLIGSNSCIAFLQQQIELPDFDKILNFPCVNNVVFDKNELVESLISLISTDEGISFIFKKKICNLQCFNRETRASSAAIVDFNSDSNPIDFKLNGKFLLDLIKRLGSKKVTIYLGDKSEDPVTVNSKNLKCVIAPMVM